MRFLLLLLPMVAYGQLSGNLKDEFHYFHNGELFSYVDCGLRTFDLDGADTALDIKCNDGPEPPQIIRPGSRSTVTFNGQLKFICNLTDVTVSFMPGARNVIFIDCGIDDPPPVPMGEISILTDGGIIESDYCFMNAQNHNDVNDFNLYSMTCDNLTLPVLPETGNNTFLQVTGNNTIVCPVIEGVIFENDRFSIDFDCRT